MKPLTAKARGKDGVRLDASPEGITRLDIGKGKAVLPVGRFFVVELHLIKEVKGGVNIGAKLIVPEGILRINRHFCEGA